MSEVRAFDGYLHSPYFIFVRGEGKYSDADLLRMFGLSHYRLTKSQGRHGVYVVLADGGPWKMIADDWWYTLCSMPSTRAAIHQLAQSCEVFAGCRGECDESFDFEYYSGGRQVREYVVASPNYTDRIVVKNTGEPLRGETAEHLEVGDLKLLMLLAESLGIRTRYTEQDLRDYAPPRR